MARVTGIGGVLIKSKGAGTDPDGNKVEFWEPKTWDDKNKR